MPERWLPVLGYEGLYEVSDRGRVRSLDRRDRRGRLRKGMIRKLQTHKFGYPTVALKSDGKQRTFCVHTLILEAFVSPRPEGHHARHLDGIPEHTYLLNLAWGTRSENQIDMADHGRAGRHQASKTECPQGHRYTTSNTVTIQRPARTDRSGRTRRASIERQCRTCRDTRWGKTEGRD